MEGYRFCSEKVRGDAKRYVVIEIKRININHTHAQSTIIGQSNFYS